MQPNDGENYVIVNASNHTSVSEKSEVTGHKAKSREFLSYPTQLTGK